MITIHYLNVFGHIVETGTIEEFTLGKIIKRLPFKIEDEKIVGISWYKDKRLAGTYWYR